MSLTIDIELPADLAHFQLPPAVAARLQFLLDRQDAGHLLTEAGATRRRVSSIWPTYLPCFD